MIKKMNRKEYIQKMKKEIVEIASLMIDGNMDLIEGCRVLTNYGQQFNDDPVFFPLEAIDSESDHFLIKGAREKRDNAYLLRLDKEKEKFLIEVKADIITACKEVIKKYS